MKISGRLIQTFLFLSQLFFISMAVSAQSTFLDDQPNSQNSSLNTTGSLSVLTEEPQFLPVDQAYQVEVSSSTNGLQVLWNIAPEYYLYRHTTKLILNQQEIDLSHLPSGKPMHDEFFGDIEAYYKSLQVDLEPTTTTALLEVHYQGCADAGLCYPPQQRYFRIDSSHYVEPLTEQQWSAATINIEKQNQTPLPTTSSLGLLAAAISAFIGGLLLNVMPCVFPILSLKLLSLAQSGHKKLHAWIYTLGVVSSFCLAALLLITFKQAGEHLGWGFQLQSSGFLWFLAYLFTVLALNMSGLVFFGGRLMGLGTSLTQSSTLKGDFFTGVLAVLVASPCSVPFMGAAVGFALTQSTVTAMLVFVCLGLGMAFPFLLFSWVPALQKLIPQPGHWMETFKQLLAFPLYLTVIWLIWVLGRQTDTSTMAFALLGCVLLAFAIWLLQFKSFIAKLFVMLVLALAAWLPFSSPLQNQQDEHWQTYSAATLQQALDNGNSVFINATADWCITCITNEVTVLSHPDVLEHFAQTNTVLMKADWTRQDPAITDLLNAHQRSGVPLYLWFDPSGKVQILPQLLSKSLILQLSARN